MYVDPLVIGDDDDEIINIQLIVERVFVVVVCLPVPFGVCVLSDSAFGSYKIVVVVVVTAIKHGENDRMLRL